MATATASVAPPSTSTSSVLLHRRLPSPAPAPASAAFPRLSGPAPPPRRARLLLRVALTNEVASDDVAAEEAAAAPKIGRRVRVTAPLCVYHVLKAPDLDIQGMEGVVKQYVCVWKGKRVTANFPFKVEFELAVEGQPKPVRFFAHLREDEFEFVDGE
ncbi:Ferredoxin-thioredoxin reductase, variable chain [Zea mays]|uniref:Ferredoxin-thioredoxin reductase, variable chain n=1 Tax=Zea mays TaxID=4577 RepID=A0A3L6EU64_MAIZE|nr:Ferredoxin-thioredoxin reductase, variable chain [Zea mays]